jgi:hypothetical protein
MVILEQHLPLGFRVKEAYFPTAGEVWRLADQLPAFATLRARQAAELPARHPRQIKHNPTTTLVVDLTRAEGELLRRMNRNTQRNVRQVDENPGVHVGMNDDATCRDFVAVYNELALAKGYASPISMATLHAHRAACDVFMSYLHGSPVCGQVFLRDSGLRRVMSLLVGSTRLREDPGHAKTASDLNRHLYWHAMRFYKAAGVEIFDLGGITDEADSITRFKMKFGGEPLREHNYAFAGSLAHLALRVHRLSPVQAVRSRLTLARA